MIDIAVKGESDWEPSVFVTQYPDGFVEINTQSGIARMTLTQFKMTIALWLSLSMQEASNDE